ncbi:hypothetical protein BDZ97DRAFT_112274 [Flammula alnicola]|nr:hypothetical protein BDZ97DRAFT_112274 [Flammula alnicola]
MVLPPPHELSLPELSAPLEIPSSTTSSSNPSTSQSSESGSWSNALDAASVAEVTVPFDAFMRLISAPLRGRSQERSSPPPLSPSSTTSSHTHSHHSHKSSKSLSSLTFSREREMVATKANPPAGSVVVQQFSSGEAPNCTIIVNPQPIAQASPYRHRRYSRSRSRSPPPPPVVIMPSRSNDPHHHHECYSHHHHPPQVVYIGQGSRSSSRTRSSRARSHSPSIYSVRSREPTPIMVPESPRLNPRSPYAHISPVPTSPLYSEHEPIIYETQTPVRVPSPTYILRPPEPSISTHSSYSPPSPYWPHHERFYFEDGTIIFRVGVTLYKIHRHFFTEQSVFFRDLFSSLNVSEHYSHEPIILSEVKTEDFDRLLSIFYPISFAEPSLKTVEEWASVLMLATKWVFTDIRALAIRNLTSIASSVDKIVLGTKYDVHDWLAPAFKDLVTRWRRWTWRRGPSWARSALLRSGR